MEGIFTLLDIARQNAATVGYNLIREAVTNVRPELLIIPADTIAGTEMTLEVLTKLPTLAFRNLNEGTPSSKPEFTTRTFSNGIIDQIIPVDKRLHEKALNKGRFLENRSMPYIEGGLDLCCRQFWYGVGEDKKGFIGMIAQSNPSTETHVVDAGGAANKQRTSVWFLSIGREKIEWLWGNERTITLDPEWKDETLYDKDNNAYPGMTNWVHGSPGLRLANRNCAVRIKNISVDEDGKTLDDDWMFKGLQKMRDLGIQPTHIMMNPRSHEQLRSSRTATNEDGKPAPLPRDFEGIPIYPTTFIKNGETI